MQAFILFFQGFSETIGVMAPICQNPARLRQTAQQSRASIIAYLPGRHEEPERQRPRIRHGVRLGVPFSGETVP